MPDDLPSRDIPAAVRRGAPWVIGGQVATQLISLGSLAYLYRQLTPEEYGLFGMALSFILLPRMLATLGLSAATVQRSSLCADERNSLFWMQTALGVVFSLIAAATAPLAAIWFGTREVIPLVLALSGTVLVVSLSATQQSLLERNLALARITSVRVLGQLIGTLIAIVAASWGWRCGALVVQQYAEITALLVCVWFIAPWWPRWPRKFVNARELFHFSGYFTLSSLLSFVIQNADKLLLGWWLGGTPAGQAIVGAYTQAYNLVMRPVYSITTPVFGVLLPTLSRAKSEPQLFQHLTITAYRLTAIMLLPCGVGLYVVGHETLLLLGGNAWSNAGYLLVAMAPSILAQGWMNLGGSVLAARGKTGLLSALTGLSLLVCLQMFVLGYLVGGQLWPLPLGAALGMAWGLTIAFTVLLLGPFLWACLRAVEIPPLAIFATLRRPLWASLMMGLIVALVKSQLPSDWPLPARLCVQVAVGVLSYVALAWPEVRWLWSKRRERVY